MEIEGIVEFSEKITSSENLINEFRTLFSSLEAKKYRGIVYFFMTDKPIPRVRGESNILYIGKSNLSLSQRYLKYSEKLASGANGEFYKYIINNYGSISLGCIETDNPKELEAEYFKKYFLRYLEYPPKSKVG